MKKTFLVLPYLIFASVAYGQGNTSPIVKVDGFIDTYYAYDFNNPPTYDRSFTTQPARSDEFNINLAYLGMTFTQDRVRGRIALQAGTSVQSNYAGEPAVGSVSGPLLSRHLQEAYAGYQLSDSVWIDAGTYLSHVGAESFISRDNPTYTRSLVADYSPYYQNGVRLAWAANEKLSLQLHLLNGWQNASENNRSKTLGTQVVYKIAENTTISYNTLIGKESEFRHFHDLILRHRLTDTVDLILQYDLGFQKRSDAETFNQWQGATAVGRYSFGGNKAFVLRAEYYADPDQIIVVTSVPEGFEVTSASLGFDIDLSSALKWRSEFRQYWATHSIYPDSEGLVDRDSVSTTSFALSF